MSQPDNPGLRQQVIEYLDANPETALTWTEAHGMLCALACGPACASGWQHLLIEEGQVPNAIADAMQALRDRMHAQLGLGETLPLPCRLDPYEDNEGKDLASWCAGFVTGVSANEDAWHANDSDQVFQMLLPFLLISGLDDDPEMDALWQDTRLVRQMALGIPDLVEEIFLFFHAPELGDDRDEDDSDEE